MQTILNDIELDLAELKYLLQALEATGDPKLTAVAHRNIDRMKQRLNDLQQCLDHQAEGVTTTPSAQEPAHAEEKAETCVREDNASAPAKEEQPAEAGNSAILAERIRPITDLRHALSLNDSFRFAREWFEGDVARLNHLLNKLSEVHTLEEAVTLLKEETDIPQDSPALTEFEELLKKYFDQ